MTTRPEALEVVELAKLWHAASAVGRADTNRFAGFISAWIALNALYALVSPNESGDRKQLRRFAALEKVRAEHTLALVEEDYRGAVRSLASQGVYNSQNGRTLAIADERDLSNVLDAVYQVRCNLFHGRKSPRDLRDHRVIEAARIITYRLVDGLLSESDWLAEVA